MESIAIHLRDNEKFHRDVISGEVYLEFPISEVLYSGKSEYQAVDIVDTPSFGQVLFMDGKVQSSQYDECRYHESLVHPVLLSHPNPKTVLIGGGGEGATLREVLKHKSVERVVMVDLDQVAVEMCIQHIPTWSQGSFTNPRAEIVYGDAAEYLDKTEEKFDVIIMDICDPLEAGPGWVLYTQEFYQKVASKNLRDEHSILATQATAAPTPLCVQRGVTPFLPEDECCFPLVVRTFSAAFGPSHSRGWRTDIPSYGCGWGFAMSRTSSNGAPLLDSDSAPSVIDALLVERLGAEEAAALEHYDGLTHRAMFSLTKQERKMLTASNKTYTMAEPIFFPGEL